MIHWWNRPFLRPGLALPAIVLVAGLVLSAAGARWRWHAIDQEAQAEFERGAERVSVEIVRRFMLPVYGLHGARGVYAASRSVERAEFRAYVESRQLDSEFPGVRGFGFIQRVHRQDLSAFVAAERADEAPQFALREFADSSHDDLYVIKFIEPASANIGALGLDVGSDPVRRGAVLRAIDSGTPAFSGVITLLQDARQTAATVVNVPVYAKGAKAVTALQRRAALQGVLFAPIVIPELLDKMPEVMAKNVDFELFDAPPQNAAARVLFDSDEHGLRLGEHGSVPADRRFSLAKTLVLPGIDFGLRVNSTPEFDARVDQTSPWAVLLIGALASALLTLLLRQQVQGRRRAESLARQMTEQLRRDEQRWRDFSLSTSDWFWETDAQHHFCYFSDNFETVYGLAPERLLGHSREELLDAGGLIPAQSVAAHRAVLEAHMPFKNFEYPVAVPGSGIRWISVSGMPYVDGQGAFAGYRGTGTVITARKGIEQRLRQQNDTLSAIVENFPGGISMVDAGLHVTTLNRRFKELLDLPDSLLEQPGLDLEDIFRFNAQRGEYGPGDVEQQVATRLERARQFLPHKFERVRPDGKVLEILGLPLPEGGFVTLYTDITERKAMERQVHQLAFYDPLTKLPNRRLFTDRMTQALAASKRSGCFGALMFLDLDNFKELNDKHGHAAGDLLLIEAASRMRACVREIDTVARLGGDEFVVVVQDLERDRAQSQSQAGVIAQKLGTALAQPYHLSSTDAGRKDTVFEHRCSASIGVTLFIDGQGSLDDFLRWADSAMYQAKAAGTSLIRFFGPGA